MAPEWHLNGLSSHSLRMGNPALWRTRPQHPASPATYLCEDGTRPAQTAGSRETSRCIDIRGKGSLHHHEKSHHTSTMLQRLPNQCLGPHPILEEKISDSSTTKTRDTLLDPWMTDKLSHVDNATVATLNNSFPFMQGQMSAASLVHAHLATRGIRLEFVVHLGH